MDETTKAIDKMISRLITQAWGYVTSGKAWAAAIVMFAGFQHGGLEGLLTAAGAGGLFAVDKTIQNIKLADSQAKVETSKVLAEAEVAVEKAHNGPAPQRKYDVPWAGVPKPVPPPKPGPVNIDWVPEDTGALIDRLRSQVAGGPNPTWALEEQFLVSMRNYDYSKHGTPFNMRVGDAIHNWMEPFIGLKRAAFENMLGVMAPDSLKVMDEFGGRIGYVAVVVRTIEQATGKCTTASGHIINQVREIYEAYEHLEGLKLLAERDVVWDRLGHDGDNPWTLGELAPAVMGPAVN